MGKCAGEWNREKLEDTRSESKQQRTGRVPGKQQAERLAKPLNSSGNRSARGWSGEHSRGWASWWWSERRRVHVAVFVRVRVTGVSLPWLGPKTMSLAWLHPAQAWEILGQGQSQQKPGPGQSQMSWSQYWTRMDSYMPTEKVFASTKKPCLCPGLA
ncbi:hypothetical protein DFH09DRAFT_1085805 [Mycena vulgaris]|nr:hypothetical protein DFH09DRAFT_1085805 [Mycena vulgaris]